MLDTLDLTLRLSRPLYRERIAVLRNELRDIEQTVRRSGIPVVIVFEGWEAAGGGDSIGSLVYPLDPRGFKVYTVRAASPDEERHPFLWRFNTRLPRAGEMVFFYGSWYRRLLEDRIERRVRRKEVPLVASVIRDFERQLTDAGTVIVKFWLHISRKEQLRRQKAMARDPYERWRVTGKPGMSQKAWKNYAAAAEEMFELTATAAAPWTLVEATDASYRRVKVFETLLDALRRGLATKGAAKGADPAAGSPEQGAPAVRRRALRIKASAPAPILDRVDLSLRLDRNEYEKDLHRLQRRLRELHFACHERGIPVVVVYEGWDAAGKGGNIKRVTQELDPRGYEVVPIAAPDATEKSKHYLVRFWQRLPATGHMAIFDRSWYGRVLVERVEGFAAEADWRRAYQEIGEFERHLTDFGTVMVKFWLHLSPGEQLRRFKERETTPWKQHKITPDDWRNRVRWNDYRAAVSEMVERTSTRNAPWTIVEAEDKLWARVRTLRVLVEALEKRMAGR